MPTAKTIRREFLQLATPYQPGKHKVGGFYISEKLDGTRCFWDGGITRGMKTKDVPWASVVDGKTGVPKSKVKPISTGLWSRYGNPIIAPDSFLNALPCCPLDGELWAGRNTFQLSRSICGGDEPDERFNQISYAVYSSPALPQIFQSGLIKSDNFLLDMKADHMERFVLSRMEETGVDYIFVTGGSTYDQELLFLRGAIECQNDQVFLHQQVKLPDDDDAAAAFAEDFLTKVLDKGGEGVVIRDPRSVWTPKRHKGLLKYKPYDDSEAVVIGYIAGEEGKQGNLLGKIGALQVRTTKLERNVEFKIGTGLTFEDREFDLPTHRAHARQHPGEEMPKAASGSLVPLGSAITFKYRELSDDGIPKEARYWRQREGVE